MNFVRSIIPIAIFSILSFIIIFPLLPPGFILTLDTVVTSKINFASITSSSFLYQNTLGLLNYLIPAFILQKIILFSIFFLSGWGMYRLAGKELGLFKYFAAVLYALNPFVYERIMAGHWQFMLGYSIFPFVIVATIKFLKKLDIWNIIVLSAWVTLLFNIAIHYIFIYIPFFMTTCILYIFFNTGKISEYLKKIIILLLLLLLMNSNWIVSSVIGISDVAISVAQFTNADLITFQSAPDKNFGLIFNLLSGYGYWAEVYDYFISPKNIIFFWPIMAIILLIFVVLGIRHLIQIKDQDVLILTISLIIISLISLDFAGGVALEEFSKPLMILYDKFPILRSLREPQKLIGVLMLSYSFFAGYGLSFLNNRLGNRYQKVLFTMSIVFPIIYTPTMFGSFWGQLRPISYPVQWHEVNQIISNDEDNFLTLFFPWHFYLSFNFTNHKVVSNPAPYFFDKPIVLSNNYETDILFSHNSQLESLHVDGLLSIEAEGINLLGEQVYEKVDWGRDLSVINVKYVILAKEDDWRKYLFLETDPSFSKIYESEEISLFINHKWATKNDIDEL